MSTPLFILMYLDISCKVYLFIPPANFVWGGYTVFTLSVHACVRPYRFVFFNIWAFKRALLFLFFLLFSTFLICSYFFLKMPYYPYFFTQKCHSHVKIQKFFFTRFACSGFRNPGSPPLRHIKKLTFTQKAISV